MQLEYYEGERYNNLNEVFNVLRLRLQEIRKGEIDSIGVVLIDDENELYKIKLETIKNNIFSFPSFESLKFIEGMIDYILDLKELSKEIIEKTYTIGWKRFPKESEQEKKESLSKINRELDFYNNELQEIKIDVNRQLEFSGKRKAKNILDGGNKIKVNDEILTFGFKKTDTHILKRIYNFLILETGDFINKEKTSEETFINILIAKNIHPISNKIHFECETTQVAEILKAMKRFSKEFSFSKIEKSKLFYTKNGLLLTASNLSKSGHKEPKQKEFIDNFFAEFRLIQ